MKKRLYKYIAWLDTPRGSYYQDIRAASIADAREQAQSGYLVDIATGHGAPARIDVHRAPSTPTPERTRRYRALNYSEGVDMGQAAGKRGY